MFHTKEISQNKLFAAFIGPLAVLLLYVGSFSVFAKYSDREALYFLNQLLVVSFVMLCAWDFIYIYYLEHQFKNLSNNIFFLFLGPVGVVVLYLVNFFLFTAHNDRDAFFVLNQLFILSFIIISAWDFIYVYAIGKNLKT